MSDTYQPRHALPDDHVPQHGGAATDGDRTSSGASNRWLVLAICCMSLFIVGLDVSGLNLALPSIRSDLHATPAHLQWIIDAYTLVLASLLMLSGSVADRIGRRLVFRTGLALFGLGSVLCAFATSGETLIAARMVQAVGGSMLNPVAMSIITNTFRNPRERAQAIGMWGGVIGLSMALGPLIGGGLVEAFSWKAIFWMNVPVVVAAIILTTLFVPESRAEHPRSLDPVGQALVMAMLGTLTYAIIEGRSDGWTSGTVLGCLGVALVSLAALLLVERRLAQPLVNPVFFSSWPFSGAVLAALLGFASMAGFLFLNTLYLQTSRGMSPVHAGLMTLPLAVCNGLFAPVSGRLVGSRGARLPMTLAGAFVAAASLMLLRVGASTSLAYLLATYAVFGIGNGLLNAPITNAAVSGMPRSQSGVASGIASTARQVGSALGVAVFGTLMFSGLGRGPASRMAAASHSSWWVMFGCGLGICAIGLLVTTPAARRSSEHVARQMSIEG